MGQADNLPDRTGASHSQIADEVLREITRDLMNLQQDLVVQLTQDIGRLQTEKSRLLSDIERLQNQYQLLQSEYQAALSRQQMAQQQLWAKQLAQALAVHLQKFLSQQISVSHSGFNPEFEPHSPSQLSGMAPSVGETYQGEAYRLLTSLDSTLSHTLRSLEQDLSSYESTLSKQIHRMHTLEQQGEALLDALVERLGQRLQEETAKVRTPPVPENGHRPEMPDVGDRWAQGVAAASRLQTPNFDHPRPGEERSASSPPVTPPPPIRPVAPAAPQSARSPRQRPVQASQKSASSGLQQGFILIILSTIALSFHNVVVGLIGFGGQIFGQIPFESLIRLSIPNSILVLCLRMLFVVPLLAIVAGWLYPPVWQDIRKLWRPGERRILVPVIGSGLFLFLSQVSIYTSISLIGPGIAVTILFMYPLVTVPLAWLLFGDRPTPMRWIVMVAISIGIVFAALPKLIISSDLSPFGIVTAIVSGIAFAFYLIFMQVSFRKVHPVPVSMIQFSTILLLALLMLNVLPWASHVLNLPLDVEVEPDNRLGLLIGGLVLGVLTLIGYLLNNFGVRLMGAARAAIIASSGPVLTAVLAFLITPGDMTALRPVQVLGIVLVTLGVAAMNFERMALGQRASKATR